MEDRRTLNLTRLGWGLALPVLLLSLMGLGAIHATDRSLSAARTGPAASGAATDAADWAERAVSAVGLNTLKQIVFFVSGLLLLWITLKIGYLRIGQLAYLIYIAVVVLLMLLLVDRYLIDLPFVRPRRNTFRWIGFEPLTVQPSEFMKLALTLALAHYLRYRSSYRTWSGLLPPFLLTLGPMALILKQPDLGTLLMLLPVLMAMLFVAGARGRHLLTIILLGVACLPAFWYGGMHEYQKLRIEVLLKQESSDETWQMDQGYQLRQSKVALGTGGIFGQGFGHGPFVRYELLPEEHNDFIFSIIGNQWGLIGCLLIIVAYVAIVFVGIEVATVTNDPFGRLLAIGVVVMIVAQAMLNMWMTLGLAPITGMPLPFVSAGGSSLWTNMIGLGLLVSVAQRRPMRISKPPFEHRDD